MLLNVCVVLDSESMPKPNTSKKIRSSTSRETYSTNVRMDVRVLYVACHNVIYEEGDSKPCTFMTLPVCEHNVCVKAAMPRYDMRMCTT